MKVLSAVLALSLLAGGASAQAPLYYVPLAEPCRALDTRLTGAPLVPGVVLVVGVMVPCEIPFEAQAVEANLTATNTQGPGFLALVRAVGRPSAAPPPKTSIVNFTSAGDTVANAALVTLGKPIEHWGGVFWIVAGGAGTDLVVDVSGYYLPAP